MSPEERDLAIKVEHLSKRFRLGQIQPYRRLGESIVRGLMKPFRRTGPRTNREILWALKDVSFTVQEGEIVGIIGPNGAGKTTLLKILAKITLPTEGRAEIYGNVGSLLEVGTGFHIELTGRENVFLNGAILGMPAKEIRAKYNDIVEFAQIPEFMDTPVKHYSSGMRVRLAFSVAAFLEPEILFIDEVLSVGDADFQAKCLRKMEEVAGAGRTVLFVSHNVGSVTTLCTRCLWIDHGTIRMDGEPQDVVEAYLTAGYTNHARWQHPADDDCGEQVRLESIEVVRRDGTVDAGVPFDEPVTIRVEIDVKRPTRGLGISLRIDDTSGTAILVTNSADTNPDTTEPALGRHRFSVEIPKSLLRPARYLITAAAAIQGTRLDQHDHCLGFDILPIGTMQKRKGIITPVLPWVMEDESASTTAHSA